jgi:Tfp pilus assembly PilM family ATPase/Tfp pilus assembly protein PilN
LARKTANISILHFDNQMISRLRVQRTPVGLEVLAFDTERGDWNSEDGSLETALQTFITAHQVAEDDIYTVLHRHDMTTRILNLPSQSPDEVEGMVRLSAEEFVPFSVDEVIIDQCILKRLPGGESQVLAVFTHRDVVETHVALLRKAGVEPRQIFLSSACMASAVKAARSEGEERFALFNLASGGLEALVFDDQGNFVFSRGVATIQDWSLEGEKRDHVLEELSIEVRGTLAAYRRESEDGMGVDQVYLCSDGATTSRAAELLSVETGKDCAPADFVLELVTSGREHLAGRLPLVSLGAALSAQDRGLVRVDLLPDSIARSRKMAAAKGKLLRAAALAALIAIALGGVYAQAVQQRNQVITELQARYQALRPQAEGVAAKRQQLQIIQREVARNSSVLQFLSTLTEVAPEEGLNMSSFSFNREMGIEITGRAKTRDDIKNFLDDLRNVATMTLPQFARATREYEGEIKERNEPVFEYKINIPFAEEEEQDEDTELAE